MKKTLLYLLLGLLSCGLTVTACTEDPEPYTPPEPDSGNTQKPDPEPDPTPVGPQAGTYKFVASELKGSWSAGDQIYVHGNMGTEAEVITLAAADISADGKTATAQVTSPTETLADPDGLYAAWPAQAVYPYKGILKVKTTFEECSGLLTISYLEGDTFNFIDVSSMLQFNVTGDYNQFAIAGNDRSGLNITRFEVEYSSEKKKFNPKQNDGYPFLYGSVEAGKPCRIWFPGDFSFASGLTIFLGKDDAWTATYTVSDAVKLTAGQTLDLGYITSGIQPYEGIPPQMPRLVKETKYTCKLNELSGLCLSADGDFLWAVGDEGDLAKISFEGEVLYKRHIGGDTEGLSRNWDTGDLVISMEPDGVGIIYAKDANETSTSRVKTLFNVAKAKNYGNAGLEGVTYYKDGLIYVGAQTDARLFCIELATGTVQWDKSMYNKQLVAEIADLCYDPLTDWLWIMDSEPKVSGGPKYVYVYTGDSQTLLGAYPVGGANPESVCVDHKNQCIWVGDDYGDTSYIYRYDMTGLDDAIIK